MKSKIFIIVFLSILSLYCMQGQDVLGKWARIDDDSTYSIPESVVIEITKKELLIYSFDSLYSKTKLKIDAKNKVFKKGENEEYSESRYKLKNDIFLTEYDEVNVVTDKGMISDTVAYKYVKLLPTIINHPIEKILNKNYEHFYGATFLRPHNNIRFDDLMCSDQFKLIAGEDSCPKYKLKKLDKTYFIIYYADRTYRKWMVPIKEINEGHLVIYGVHGKDGFVKLHEIKEIKEENNFFKKH
ncbi:hypothetical protein [Aquimarina sp. 2201CG5-10]|uniref:hypothetical protein n=1 Tax=Aquimarina callyspongiae TaxID=3098150 RepID=UPI002AB5C352|nr:hypothetical protein [Aquimarina sp. 2201CG5-10]MDY8137511.1 hypothetical protein [Aquimarina sp. 2201CG5-10]